MVRDLTATEVTLRWEKYYEELNKKLDTLTELCLDILLAKAQEITNGK